MTEAEFRGLRRGDIVRGADGDSYVILSGPTSSGCFSAVREVTLSNPDEWQLVKL